MVSSSASVNEMASSSVPVDGIDSSSVFVGGSGSSLSMNCGTSLLSSSRGKSSLLVYSGWESWDLASFKAVIKARRRKTAAAALPVMQRLAARL